MKIIFGAKGTGKTKAIIDGANSALDQAKGHVVFVTDTNRYTYDLKYQIRFLNTCDFGISNIDGLAGFLKGIVASSGDNEYIFLDGVARITESQLSSLETIFTAMDKLEKDYGVKFVVTCSSDKEALPEFVLKYVD